MRPMRPAMIAEDIRKNIPVIIGGGGGCVTGIGDIVGSGVSMVVLVSIRELEEDCVFLRKRSAAGD